MLQVVVCLRGKKKRFGTFFGLFFRNPANLFFAMAHFYLRSVARQLALLLSEMAPCDFRRRRANKKKVVRFFSRLDYAAAKELRVVGEPLEKPLDLLKCYLFSS